MARPATDGPISCKDHRNGPHKDCPGCWHALWDRFEAEKARADEAEAKIGRPETVHVGESVLQTKTLEAMRERIAALEREVETAKLDGIRDAARYLRDRHAMPGAAGYLFKLAHDDPEVRGYPPTETSTDG